MKLSKRKQTLAKEQVKGMFQKKSPQEAAGHNSVPSNKPYYCVSWSFMFFFAWLKLILWKAFGFDSKKNEAK